MKIVTADNETAVEIAWVGRRGGDLLIWGRVLGTMQMEMHITPEEMCKGVKALWNLRMLSYGLLLPYFMLRVGVRTLVGKLRPAKS
jgi:hypothetical protein